MTIFFDLGTLEKQAGNDLRKYVTLLEAFYYNRLPRKNDVRRKSLVGSSFLLNPLPLFNVKDVDIIYIVQYIKLAAKRDYNLYKYFSVKSLLLSYYPEFNSKAVKSNPLLKITQTNVIFLYEEKEITWH